MKTSVSIFDIFKIGVGPSSSHTLGPWRAARVFLDSLAGYQFDEIMVELYGSLALTGKGHCTDIAVIMGLQGVDPTTVKTEAISETIKAIHKKKELFVLGRTIAFDSARQIIFKKEFKDLVHPNTVVFIAKRQNHIVFEETFFSVGGGFIEKKGERVGVESLKVLPFPIQNAKELLSHCRAHKKTISEIVFENEISFRSEKVVDAKIKAIFEIMTDSVFRGCRVGGILPGGLKVKRRAKYLHNKLLSEPFTTKKEWFSLVQRQKRDFVVINQWVSCFSLAVNEENANLGRIVSAPTNGAAGVIPSVLLYYYLFCEALGRESGIKKFLFAAGEIGSIFKKNATISAALGGCQAEIGVSSAMAAGGLTEVLGGDPSQVLMAAEIAMEHHLGLTCDPIGGLVQIPCIERNAMGAIKAITASNLALNSDPSAAKVDLDSVIKTMWETAKSMNTKYKETSLGGLAVNVPINVVEC